MVGNASEFEELPSYLILPDKVYKLEISPPIQNRGRAFDRSLIDYNVAAYNPLDSSDRWQTLLGMSFELSQDYPSYRFPIPLGWLLFRFLCHHVRTNSIDILSGSGGEVLTTTKFQYYLGNEIDDDKAEEILKIILTSWVRIFPEKNIDFSDIYASTDLSLYTLKRAINILVFKNQIKSYNNSFLIKPTFSQSASPMSQVVSLDRKNNRYFQEILIEAKKPFCFVIMPFRNEEFDQRIYFEIIKPLLENEFKLSCYRVDEDNLPDLIDNKIYTYLLKASFIIAEISTKNPNVFYELGLAHMLEKDCIIITKFPYYKIPFDINNINISSYENDEQLKDYLRKAISALAFKINR